MTTGGADRHSNFRFKVTWDGNFVAAVSNVSALRGGGPDAERKIPSPGQTSFEPITLERGVTWDPDFDRWANRVWNSEDPAAADEGDALEEFRKDIRIELYNVAGQRVMAYKVYRCWPSQYTSLPELDAMSNAVTIESLTLQHEGWERNTTVATQEPNQ